MLTVILIILAVYLVIGVLFCVAAHHQTLPSERWAIPYFLLLFGWLPRLIIAVLEWFRSLSFKSKN